MSHQQMPSNVFAVVLAGGSGTRFWPKSRQRRPKQLCALGGSTKTMLEVTLDRLEGFVPESRRLIVTHKDQVAETRKVVGSKCPVIIAEPDARNTANALALAALEIRKMGGGHDAVMISLHADHVIEKVDEFKKSLTTAVKVALSGDLCLIGIVPKYPETGFGYIERGEQIGDTGAFKVRSFREKPERKIAEEFLASGRFYWNAGLFVFPVDTLLKELESKLPASIKALADFGEGIKSYALANPAEFAAVYSNLPKISIDHAVLEVSKRVSVVEADIGWQDIGSWDALSRCFGGDSLGNYKSGDVLLIDSSGCTVDTDGPLTALVGVKDLVVVHAMGAILVCPKDRSQDVKLIVDQLKAQSRLDQI